MTMGNVEAAGKELESALGKRRVLSDDFVLSSYTKDGTVFYYPLSLPSLVVLPYTTEEVQKIVQVANKYKIPVIPTGGRTSHWGAIDSNRGIVIDMCNMRNIIEIDEKNLTFTVQAGANVHHVSGDVLRKRGFCYPVHALNFAPISFGAEVAKNTGGEVGCMYGHVAKHIVGLEVVLGNGDILITGSSRVIKNAPNFQQSGIPDLTQLFVASEGALGVITEVTMRMSMVPVAEEGIDVRFEGTGTFNRVISACHEIRLKKIARNAHLVDVYTDKKEYFHLFLLEIESLISQEECDLKKKAALEICKKHGGKYIGDEMAETTLPQTRGKEFLEKLVERQRGTIPMLGFADVPYEYVPKIHEKFLETLDRCDWPREKSNFVGAFGDESCLTFCILQQNPNDNEGNLQKCKEVFGKVLKFYTEIGTIPYRIGRIWRPYILDKLDPSYLRYVRSLKREFDPNNIMNPGVSVFEEEYK